MFVVFVCMLLFVCFCFCCCWDFLQFIASVYQNKTKIQNCMSD